MQKLRPALFPQYRGASCRGPEQYFQATSLRYPVSMRRSARSTRACWGRGTGEAAMQRDSGAGNSRPPAPHRSEPGDGEAGDDDDGNQVDDTEQHDVAVARDQQRAAYGDDIERNDH